MVADTGLTGVPTHLLRSDVNNMNSCDRFMLLRGGESVAELTIMLNVITIEEIKASSESL